MLYTILVVVILWFLFQVFGTTVPFLRSQHNFDHDTAALSKLEKVQLCVVTRIHSSNSKGFPSIDKISSFIDNVKLYSPLIIIAVDLGNDMNNLHYISSLKNSMANLFSKEDIILKILPVSPWGNYVNGLNAAIIEANKYNDCKFIAFQSLEVKSSPPNIDKLLGHLKDNKTIVVGPHLSGHTFQKGINKLTGRTCPWNTLAIWNLEYLSKFGFVMASEGFRNSYGGVEEVAVISLLQHFDDNLKAKLIMLNDDETKWNTHFVDPERLIYHEKKMASKNERPEYQLKSLNLFSSPGSVIHIEEIL